MVKAIEAQAPTWYVAPVKTAKKITFKVADWGRANPLRAAGVVVLTGLAGITLYKLLYPRQRSAHPPK